MDINFIYLRSDIAANNSNIDALRRDFLYEILKNDEIKISDRGRPIFFIESGGTEEKFKRIYKEYLPPYYILATDANNSLPASLEIMSFLSKQGLEAILIHGTKEEIKSKLLNLKDSKHFELNKISHNKLLEGERLGLIGKPSDWLISSDVSYQNAKDTFGVTLVDISFNEFKEEIEKAITPDFALDFVNKYESEKIDRNSLVGALQIYSAIKNLVIKYKLNGVTVRCFDLLGTIKNTSCLALALLNKEGITATCEGDVPAMLTMHIIRKLFNESSFQANPSYINAERKYLLLAHCTLPLDMTSSFKMDTHFESGIGVGIKGELLTKDVTIFKMNSLLNKFVAIEGKIDSNLSRPDLCRSQIKVVSNEDLSMLTTNPCGNHLIVFYGHHKDELIKELK